MNAGLTITTELDSDTLHAVTAMAADRGISTERLAGELIRQAVAEEAKLVTKIEQGRRQIAAGEYVTHEELVHEIQRWKQEQRRAT